MPFQLINQCSWEPVKTWVNVSLNEWQRWTDRQVSYLNSGYAAGSFITYFSRPIHSAHVDVLGVLPVLHFSFSPPLSVGAMEETQAQSVISKRVKKLSVAYWRNVSQAPVAV